MLKTLADPAAELPACLLALDGEVGYWRTAGTYETGLRVEVMLAHPDGIVEVFHVSWS